MVEKKDICSDRRTHTMCLELEKVEEAIRNVNAENRARQEMKEGLNSRTLLDLQNSLEPHMKKLGLTKVDESFLVEEFGVDHGTAEDFLHCFHGWAGPAIYHSPKTGLFYEIKFDWLNHCLFVKPKTKEEMRTSLGT